MASKWLEFKGLGWKNVAHLVAGSPEANPHPSGHHPNLLGEGNVEVEMPEEFSSILM
jgi:hypothetical protein